MKNNFLLYASIIGIGFLWTGSSYISQLYRLQSLVTPEMLDIIGLRWNYLAQAFGILLYIFLFKYKPKITTKRSFFIGTLIIDAILMTVTLLSKNCYSIFLFGLAMNIFHGLFAAIYLSLLATNVDPKRRGISFGVGYAFGSIGTYLMSIIDSGNFIKTTYVVYAYLIIILINIVLAYLVGEFNNFDSEKFTLNINKDEKKKILLLLALILLMGFISSVGSQYHFQLVSSRKVSLELSRTYYAIGLIIAGIINDRSRKLGAIVCFVSLTFPFIQVVLHAQQSLIAITWGISYLILGFYTVYRSISFVDIASDKYCLIHIAGVDLATGCIGEALFTFIPSYLFNNSFYGTLIVISLFVPFTFLFLFFYQVNYLKNDIIPIENEPINELNELDFSLTRRENEVLKYLLLNYSNMEISSSLFISESTVKFHIKNILRKTGCSNRSEIINLYRGKSIN